MHRRVAHAVKITLRAGMFTPMAKVSVAMRIFLAGQEQACTIKYVQVHPTPLTVGCDVFTSYCDRLQSEECEPPRGCKVKQKQCETDAL